MHSNATAGVRSSQDKVRDNWQCQVMSSYKIRQEVHSSVRAQLRVKNSYKIRCTAVPLQVQGNDKTK